MRSLFWLLLLLAALALLHPARPEEAPAVVDGYWLHADGTVTLFVRHADGRRRVRVGVRSPLSD